MKMAAWAKVRIDTPPEIFPFTVEQLKQDAYRCPKGYINVNFSNVISYEDYHYKVFRIEYDRLKVPRFLYKHRKARNWR